MITAAIINYNCGQYLGKCIEQFQKQKHLSEIIIVDDCSTDNSKEIADKYGIKWLQTPKNSGDIELPIKMIIDYVKTPYFFYLASDDWVADDCFEILYTQITEYEKDLVSSSIVLTDENENILETWNIGHKSPEEMVFHIFNSGGSGCMNPVGLHRTEFMKKVGYIRYQGVLEDTLNTLNYLKNDIRYLFVPLPLLFYRQHKTNISRNISSRVERVTATMKFVYNNFDEKIYMPQIAWEQLNDIPHFKLFMMGRIFINLFEQFASNRLPAYLKCDLSSDELKKTAEPFLIEAQKFLQQANKNGDFQKEIEMSLDEVNLHLNAIKQLHKET